MVQLKSKPVQYLPPPKIRQEEAEVWMIPQTKELFNDYEAFLARRDFYSQRVFTCTRTHRSKLTFFQAFQSESTGKLEPENLLPEQLREAILRRVQFSVSPRLDDLVKAEYDYFKENFFPGESVIATTDKDELRHGVIREKITFHEVRGPDGGVQRGVIDRYFVKLREGSQPAGEKLVDNQHLARDRKVFSKNILRAFLKDSLTREPMPGAMWLVKKDIAQQYKVPIDPPGAFALGAANKAAMFFGKDQQAGQGTFFNFLATQQRPLGMKPEHGFGKLVFPQTQAALGQQGQLAQFQQPLVGPGQNHFATQILTNGNAFPNIQPYTSFKHHSTPAPAAPKPPPQKFPTEDLEIIPKKNGLQRPALQTLTRAPPLDEDEESDEESKGETTNVVDQKSVGPMLEIWNTLNVHAEVFVLDSFTFDDFVDAMCFSSEDRDCELLNELHCAILKQLVSADGKVQVHLPEIEDDDEDEDEDEESEESEAEREPTPPVRTTRSSLAKSEAAALAAQREPSPPKQIHQAAEMLADYDWVDRLKARDFQDGGWEVILIGILRQLSMNPVQKDQCEKILAELAPLDMEPTAETAELQYCHLDVNMRVEALQMISMLAITTKSLRDSLEQMSEGMTELRKKKISHQRERKALLEQLRELDDQRKLLMPQTNPEDPSQGVNGHATTNHTPIPVEPEPEPESSAEEEEEETSANGRSLRSRRIRGNEKKRKREEEAAARKEKKAKEAAKLKASGPATQLQKLEKQIAQIKEKIRQTEESITETDSDLRETNCQRTKCLGKDRFCNRYYWFERNGMPYGGLPESSTAHYGYANARLWVQGPDKMEREGFLELDPEMKQKYKSFMGMTVLERRTQEEGSTSLYDAHEWGYIDDPEELDKLIAWLDERGVREKALRKELQAWRDPIIACMRKYRDWQQKQLAKRLENAGVRETRISTRNGEREKSMDAEVQRHPCLAWTNSYAMHSLHHIHSRQPKPRAKKGGNKKVSFGEAVTTTGRNGKAATRGNQGSRSR